MAKSNHLTAEQKDRICENCERNLKIMRTYLGWKQADLAEAVGTTHRRISEIENGKSKMSWTLFMALATVFALNKSTRHSPVYRTIISDEVLAFISGGSYHCEGLLSVLEQGEDETETK